MHVVIAIKYDCGRVCKAKTSCCDSGRSPFPTNYLWFKWIMLKDRHLSSSLQNRFSWFHNLYKIVGLSIFLYMQINVHVRVQSLVSLLQIWLCALCEFLFSFKENMNKSISLLSKLIPMAKCLLYFQSCCQILNYSAENFFIIP